MAAAIDQMVAHARSQLDRVPAEDLADEVAKGAVIVDIRPIELRDRDGEMPGAHVIDRNVLLWRLDQRAPQHRRRPGPAGHPVL